MSLTDSSDETSLRGSAGAAIRATPGAAPGPAPDPDLTPADPPARRRSASPGLAAILSLVFPGLGQLFAGAVARGVLVALPTILLIVIVGVELGSGLKALLGQLVQPGVVIGIVVLNGIYGIYHLFAIADAWWTARRLRRAGGGRASGGPRSAVVLAAALVAATAFHGLVGSVGIQAYQTVSTVIVGPGSSFSIPIPSFSLGTITPDGTLSPTPTAGPAWAADGRLNLLLIGGDSGPGRTLVRTDTMILLSVDVATGRAALFGIPRNLINVPLPPESAGAFPNGRFPGLLNALWVYAIEHPKDFPGGDARGFRAITGAIQQLTGVPLDGAVIVNLNGFVDLVNAVAPKGIWLRTQRIHDDRYPLEDGSGYITLDISAGCHLLNGHLALAYARSRHQDSDYGRMERQQQVLVAMLRQLDPIGLLPHVPHLLDIAKDNLTLAIPSADLGSLASLAASVDPNTVERIGFSPPDYREFLTTKEIGRIQRVVRTIFGTAAPASSSSPSPSGTAGPTASPSAAPKACGPG